MGKMSAIQALKRESLDKQFANNSRSISDSMKSQVSLLEQKNSIKTFSESNCETQEENAGREEFFRLKRKQFLKSAHEVR